MPPQPIRIHRHIPSINRRQLAHPRAVCAITAAKSSSRPGRNYRTLTVLFSFAAKKLRRLTRHHNFDPATAVPTHQ